LNVTEQARQWIDSAERDRDTVRILVGAPRQPYEIIAYRDKTENQTANGYQPNYGHGGNYIRLRYDSGDSSLGAQIADIREGVGFATAAEVAIPIRRRALAGAVPLASSPLPHETLSNEEPDAYYVADGGTTDDGLGVGVDVAVQGDFTKYETYYAWMSNHIDVRSDVYLVYLRLQIGNSTTETDVKRYVGLIDRSNVHTKADTPAVLIFSELN
jgi:hypothetical protein